MSSEENHRILVIDDNPAIHADFRKILGKAPGMDDAMAEAKAALFGGEPARAAALEFEMESALQGQEGLEMVRRALAAGHPYAMAFVDIRMPPGWDGIETVGHIWREYPDLQVVLCTAYSDYSWDDMRQQLGWSDRLLILKKPFDAIEVLQLAQALTQKWCLLQQSRHRLEDLERRVAERTQGLQALNQQLQLEIRERERAETQARQARDVAERASGQLAASNEQLESAVVRANQLAVSAQAAARAKTAFLSTMGYEIRTPMNGVIGMLSLLAETPLTEEQREYAEIARVSGESLLVLIDAILNYAKIEAGKTTLETVDFELSEVAETPLDLLGEKARAKGLELGLLVRRDTPTRLRGDPEHLRQILLNLAGNAVKFTHQGEVVIEISTRAETPTQVELYFAVRDTGIGLSEEARSTLFQAFTQADTSTTRRYGGTGLGLAISKKLTELIGGQIGALSGPGQGSTFWFTARVDKQTGEATAGSAEYPDLTGVKALIVQGHDARRKILSEQLAVYGIQGGGASKGAEALALLRQETAAGKPFQLVVTDYQLSEMNGLALAREIRADPAIAPVEIILLTARHQRPDREQITATRIASCLFRPVKPSQLAHCLAVLFAPDGGAKPAEPHPVDTADTPVAPRVVGPLNILVAENNPVSLEVAMSQLQKLGYAADIAATGVEALAAASRKVYDVILMDCAMPELDGYEATRRIREGHHGNPSVHIIAMTANALPGDREKCLEAGMDDYMSKPVHLDQLSAALRKVARRGLRALFPPAG